ncbi:MAG: glycerophosphodiester phosphodiesterase [Cyanophyceae cyanobacterium]
MPERPLILGHRGDSAHGPENTLAAVRLAIAAGADGIEVDLQPLADGAIALCHDLNLRRLTGRDQPTGSLTAAAARSLDVGLWFGEQFRGEPMPLLEDLLTLTDPWPGLLNLELKLNDPGQHLPNASQNDAINAPTGSKFSDLSELEDCPDAGREPDPGEDLFIRSLPALVALLSQGDRLQRCCLTSFDLDLLRAVRSRLPQAALGWLTAAPFTADPAPELNFCCYAIAQDHITPAAIADIHRRDRAVWAWTVDDRDRAAQLNRWGIDALISNDPGAILTALTPPNLDP